MLRILPWPRIGSHADTGLFFARTRAARRRSPGRHETEVRKPAVPVLSRVFNLPPARLPAASLLARPSAIHRRTARRTLPATLCSRRRT